MGRLDTTFKELIARHLATLLPWLLPGCEFEEIKVEPSALPATTRDVDLLIRIVRSRRHPRGRVLHILECQCQADPLLPKTMLLRAAIAHYHYDLPVTTTLLAFTRQAAPSPEYVYGRSGTGDLVHGVVVRHIYAEPAEEALALDLPALLPLIPAMQPRDGDRRALLGEILERIARLPVSLEDRRRLMDWAATFATLHLKSTQVQNIVDDVSRRNRFMLDPLRDFPWLRDSFEKGEKKGEQAGEQKGERKAHELDLRKLRDTAIELCRARFGDDQIGIERIRRLQDFDQISRLIVQLGTAASLAEALASLPAE